MAVDDAYRDKTVFVTGHTGFKGAWLTEWLLLSGANVVGYALDPPTEPSAFAALQTGRRMAEDIRADVRDLDALRASLVEHEPDFVFHLAAQSLVRRGYAEPLYTFDTNVTGSLNVLEALRQAGRDCVVVMVTTDKVYENRESASSYREDDRLGGFDPYSASKAGAEIVISSYQRSFFDDGAEGVPGIAVGVARGGNVVGGGDWAEDRIVPDSMRSLARGEPIPVRNPQSTRPWQHVLEPLGGYLHLGSAIAEARADRNGARTAELCSPFNFGPGAETSHTVERVVSEVLTHWPGEWRNVASRDAPHEAAQLNLNIDKAERVLGWKPIWSLAEALRHAVEWYLSYYESDPPDPARLLELTQGQIRAYAGDMAAVIS